MSQSPVPAVVGLDEFTYLIKEENILSRPTNSRLNSITNLSQRSQHEEMTNPHQENSESRIGHLIFMLTPKRRTAVPLEEAFSRALIINCGSIN